MSIRRSGLDLMVLPRGLLSDAKGHLRIDGTWDDYTVVQTIARAIGWFERETGVSINAATYTWKPTVDEFIDGMARVPVSPVNSWTAAIGATDATSSYAIESDTLHGVQIENLVGAWASGLTVIIPSGYTSVAAIDPGIVDAVFRYTAHLYEHREILVAGSEAQTPGWMDNVIATWWKPRL